MSRIKSYLLGFIILCTTISAFGQDQVNEPQECKTPSGGVQRGGDFYPNTSVACLDFTTSQSPVKIQANYLAPDGTPPDPGTTYFLFNYKDSDGQPVFPTTPTFETTYTKPGFYWIMMLGKKNGNSFINCKRIEVLETPKLQLDYDACSANTVTINVLSKPENQVYSHVNINWQDGNIEQKAIPNPIPPTGFQLTHTYTGSIINPKIQGLHVRSGVPACYGNTYDIIVNTSTVPKITNLDGLNGGSEDKITITGGAAGTEYNVEMATGSGAWAATGQKITAQGASTPVSVTITGLSGTNDYCFRLQKMGVCSVPKISDPVCTIKSTYQVLNPESVKIDWSSKSYVNPPTSSSIIRYKIWYREIGSITTLNSAIVTPSANPSFTFPSMKCQNKYEFWIEGSWGVTPNRVQITSPVFQVNPNQGGLIPNTLISFASVSDNEVRITMYPNGTPHKKYNILKSEGNTNNFKPLISVNAEFYSDLAVEQDKQQYCYRVEFEDDCGNKSELSDPFCTVFLTSPRANTLSWTPFIISDPSHLRTDLKPVEYTVQLLDANYSIERPLKSTFDTEIEMQQELDDLLRETVRNGKVNLRVVARQDGKLEWNNVINDFPLFTYSNPITFITPASIYVPTAFTPNGDGPLATEKFKAFGEFISEFNMVIYNRWGAPIFESKNITDGWDGTENGNPAPPGNYSYKIFGLDNGGRQFKRLGSVLLLR
jgi:gliding motility-associated-like protein